MQAGLSASCFKSGMRLSIKPELATSRLDSIPRPLYSTSVKSHVKPNHLSLGVVSGLQKGTAEIGTRNTQLGNDKGPEISIHLDNDHGPGAPGCNRPAHKPFLADSNHNAKTAEHGSLLNPAFLALST